MSNPAYRRLALILALGITLARLLVAGRVGLGDVEAYYWVWSTHLAPGYLDHGPVVALLIRLGTLVAGDTPLGVRLLFVLLSGATLVMAGSLAARAAGGLWAAGFWSITCLLAAPAFMVAGAAANPDVPLLALVLLVTAVLARGLPRASPVWSALAGLLAGAAFSTKYLGGLLLLPLLEATWRHPRRWRATALALLAALAGALPVLIWNLQHGWASFVYHLSGRHTRPPGPSLENAAKLLGGQVAYLSPLVLAGLVAAAARLWRQGRQDPLQRSWIMVAAPLLLSGYLLILVVPGAEPHWPGPGYLPLVLALGTYLPAWLEGSRRVRVLTWIALIFSGLVAAAFHLHVLTDLGVRIMPAGYVPRYDLSNELAGWPRVADRLERQLAQLRGKRGGQVAVAGCHYTTCSQLIFASRGRFAVLCPSVRLDQLDFMPGGDGSLERGLDLVYVQDERFPFSAEKLFFCASSRVLERVRIERGGRVVRRFELQLCRQFRGLRSKRWPPP